MKPVGQEWKRMSQYLSIVTIAMEGVEAGRVWWRQSTGRFLVNNLAKSLFLSSHCVALRDSPVTHEILVPSAWSALDGPESKANAKCVCIRSWFSCDLWDFGPNSSGVLTRDPVVRGAEMKMTLFRKGWLDIDDEMFLSLVRSRTPHPACSWVDTRIRLTKTLGRLLLLLTELLNRSTAERQRCDSTT